MNNLANDPFRFLGTTPDSSNIRTLLYSVTTQIKKAYGDTSDTPKVKESVVINVSRASNKISLEKKTQLYQMKLRSGQKLEII